MKRAVKAFLTSAVIVIVLINLVLILLYGRQFQACNEGSGLTVCSELLGSSAPADILTINLVAVLAIGLLGWAMWVYLRSMQGAR